MTPEVQNTEPDPFGISAAGVQRGQPDVDNATVNFVSAWIQRIKHAEEYDKDAFARMREDMIYARLGANADWVKNKNYVANITQRLINRAVSSLYAKNPKAEAKRRRRLEFRVWNGDPAEYMAAAQQLAANPLDPNAMALILDVEEAKKRNVMLDRMGKTTEILFNYFTSEQEPSFKARMKQLVRRTKVCGVGYLKLGFQRKMEKRPEVSAEIADLAGRVSNAERIMKDMLDGELPDDSPDIVELRGAIRALQEQETVIAREGPVFEFPRSPDVIVDPRCTQIKGFVGARWIAVKLGLMTPADVLELYNVDVKGAFTEHKEEGQNRLFEPDGEKSTGETGKNKGAVVVYEVQDKKAGTVFTVAEGYKGFLKEPQAPDVKLERFFDVFPLVFNEIEDEKERYPYSDVYYIRHPQDELNRARQGLREHKHANRPAYAVVKGRLEDEDKRNLQDRPPNAIIELASMKEGESVGNLLQGIQPVGIDPNTYETNSVFDDILRVAGEQEANFGPARGKNTATESAIAESSRTDSLASGVDDLDEFLSEVARATGHVMLLELDRATVEEIVGPGAVWPEMTREEVVKDLYLEIKAGSSGRPNRAAELANYERAMPFITQFPGVNPLAIIKPYLQLLEIDTDDAIAEGLPSIVALNAMATRAASTQPDTGQANDPKRQGAEGGDNAPQGRQEEPGPQPTFPQTGDKATLLG